MAGNIDWCLEYNDKVRKSGRSREPLYSRAQVDDIFQHILGTRILDDIEFDEQVAANIGSQLQQKMVAYRAGDIDDDLSLPKHTLNSYFYSYKSENHYDWQLFYETLTRVGEENNSIYLLIFDNKGFIQVNVVLSLSSLCLINDLCKLANSSHLEHLELPI